MDNSEYLNFLKKNQLPKTDTRYTALGIFFKFFDDDALNIITQYTNTCKNSKDPVDINDSISLDEIKKFIVINIYFSIYHLAEKLDYWKSDLIITPIRKILSYARYNKINKYFHISKFNHEQLEIEGLSKYLLVEEFIEIINKRLIRETTFSSFLTIDESMCAYKGRSKYKQYLKMKKRKWGLKIFTIADSFTSYSY